LTIKFPILAAALHPGGYSNRKEYQKQTNKRLGAAQRCKPDIGKYSSVNRTTQLWNRLPEDALGTLSCKPSGFRKRVRKVINRAK
jgi:hypothetical protein